MVLVFILSVMKFWIQLHSVNSDWIMGQMSIFRETDADWLEFVNLFQGYIGQGTPLHRLFDQRLIWQPNLDVHVHVAVKWGEKKEEQKKKKKQQHFDFLLWKTTCLRPRVAMKHSKTILGGHWGRMSKQLLNVSSSVDSMDYLSTSFQTICSATCMYMYYIQVSAE